MSNLKLTSKDQSKWFHNLKVFLAPVGIIYIIATIGYINANEGKFALEYFIPNGFTLGAISLYVLNSLLDYLRKLKV